MCTRNGQIRIHPELLIIPTEEPLSSDHPKWWSKSGGVITWAPDFAIWTTTLPLICLSAHTLLQRRPWYLISAFANVMKKTELVKLVNYSNMRNKEKSHTRKLLPSVGSILWNIKHPLGFLSMAYFYADEQSLSPEQSLSWDTVHATKA